MLLKKKSVAPGIYTYSVVNDEPTDNVRLLSSTIFLVLSVFAYFSNWIIPSVIGSCFSLIILVHYLLSAKEEKATIIRGQCVLLQSIDRLNRKKSSFVEFDKIQDVLINEHVDTRGAKYYLSILIKGESEVEIIFPNLLPRLDILKEVRMDLKEALDNFQSRQKKEAAAADQSSKAKKV
mmetsp:Transcript_20822/g.37258  ORF Transcript_20822/g.37258 Transcript_20822/m.37258 type:complete len:179 (-) Transcript_20822:564-1100(-)